MASQQRVTIGEIARRLGLSKATVSNALNGKAEQKLVAAETARQVNQLAADLGYVPNGIARSLRKQRSGIVGVLLADITWDWSAHVFSGMEAAFDPAGLLPIFAIHSWKTERTRREIQSMVERRVDGLIIANPLHTIPDCYDYLQRIGLPFLFLNDSPQTYQNANLVTWDSHGAIRTLVQLLAEQGRRKFAYVGKQYHLTFSDARVDVYRATLQELGLPCREDFICIGSIDDRAKHLMHTFVQQHCLNPDDRPDAIICIHDAMANGLLRQLIDNGVGVPDTIAVTGLGCFPSAGYKGIGITSAEEPMSQMGEQAARMMIDLIANPDQPIRQIKIDHLAVQRLESTEMTLRHP